MMTNSEILDRLAWTCAAVKRDGVTPEGEFFRYFPTSADKLRFDGFLLTTQDPLIYEAGTLAHFIPFAGIQFAGSDA